MNKNQSPSISKLLSDTTPVFQDSLLQHRDDHHESTLHNKSAQTKLTPGMAQAIQESIEVSFGK